MVTYDYNTGTPLTTGQSQSVYNTTTGKKIGEPSGSTIPSYTSPSPVGSSVVTSKAAQDDYNNIKTQHADIVNGIKNQANNVANFKAQQDAVEQTRIATQKQAEAEKQRLAVDQAKAGIIPTPPIGSMEYDIANNLAPGTSSQPGFKPVTPKTNESILSAEQAERARINEEYQEQSKQVQRTLQNIQNGSIPLSPDQQAQIQGLQQSFQQLIDNQVLANKTDTGLGYIRGYQKGAAEYDPSFQVKTIGSIITGGVKKIADLNIQMSTAVAKMTEGFKLDNAQAVKESFKLYQDAYTERVNGIQKVIEETQAAIKRADEQAEIVRKENEAREKEIREAQLKEIEDINSIIKDSWNAPKELLAQASKARSVAEAVSILGDYVNTPTGIVGEYTYYKNQAQALGINPMSFEEYQDADANRKKLAAEVIEGGYTSNQNKLITSTNDKVSKNAVYQATTNMQKSVGAVQAALSLANGLSDIAAINQFQKIIDEGAVTRDQDVVLIQGAQSLAGTLQTKINKLKKGDQLSPEQRKQMLELTTKIYAKQKEALINDPYVKSKVKELERLGVSPDDTILGEITSNFGEEIIKTQEQAKESINNYYKANPNDRPLIEALYTEQDPVTGKPYTEEDIVKYLKSRGKPISFSPVGGDTDLASGIVGGYDIKSYATDPTHEKKVATLYSKIPDIQDEQSVDSYIKSVSPKSPVTGSMVIKAANKYGVDPKMMLAIMIQDSSLGTKGLATKTFNPGNVGNTDDGSTKNYGSWDKGVEAVAKNLQWRKVNNNLS